MNHGIKAGGSRTIPEAFLATMARVPEHPAYATKTGGEYRSVNWATAAEAVRKICGGLVKLGLKKGDRLALLSPNRMEWALMDLGAQFLGVVTVPVYASLPVGQVQLILADCGACTIALSGREQLDKVLACRSELPALERVILFPEGEEFPEDEFLLSYRRLLQLGGQWLAEHPGEADRLATSHDPGDLMTLIYTSGTTGQQKGVMLSHRNIVSNLESTYQVFRISEEDVFLSFLPLSHVFERMAGYYMPMHAGACVCYAQDMTTVGEDLPDARPTVMISVPRLFEKIHARIIEKAEKGPRLKLKIFHWALGVGRRVAQCRTEHRLPGFLLERRFHLADKLVFGKIRERTGGRLRFAVSGGAPLRKDLCEFFLSVGLLVIEGYGLTESSPVLSANTPDDFRFGTVGRPYPGVDLRIAPDGEILARGENVMLGYYNRPGETEETLAEGWLHTGDIGHFDEDGFLVITDRKKNLIVTSGGKNIAPQPIENLLASSPLIEQVMLVGERRNFVSALIVPSFDLLRDELGLSDESPPPTTEEIANRPEVSRLIDAEIQRLSRDLAQYERVRKFSLLGSEFSIESGELTPSLKVRRPFVLDKYRELIEGMYLTSDHKDRQREDGR